MHGLDHSYVIPSAGLLKIDARDLVEEPRGREVASRTLIDRFIESGGMYVHEWGHILQHVFYPYLALRALRDNGIIDKVLSDLRDDPEEMVGVHLRVVQELTDSFGLDAADFRVAHIPATGGWTMRPPEGEKRRPNDICDMDLIEEANAIFEFQVEIGGPGDAAAYMDWLHAGKPRYSRVFKLLARAIGPKNAYEVMAPLIVSCFHTTYPVTAFVSLLNSGIRKELGIEPDKAARRFRSRLKKVLEGKPFKARQLAGEDQFAFIDNGSLRAFIKQFPAHPLAPLLGKVWESDRDDSSDWLYRPYEAIKANGHRLRAEGEEFEPPVIVLYFGEDSSVQGNFIATQSEFYQTVGVPGAPDGSWTEVIAISYARRILVENMLGLSGTKENLCPHVGCSLFGSGLCNGYQLRPTRAELCLIPRVVEGATRRRYDPRTRTLRKIA